MPNRLLRRRNGAILERLQERRQELKSRGREIDLRESLLNAAEKKFEAHATELRELESAAGAGATRKDEAEAQRLHNLVTMYENMKAKDAARIFRSPGNAHSRRGWPRK